MVKLATPSRDDVLQNLMQTEIILFMHGMYIVLVGLALWSLLRRKPAGYRVLSGLIIAMCIFGTVEMVLQAVDERVLVRALYSTSDAEGQSIKRSDDRLTFAENLLVVTNSAIADTLLIYRCYVLWDRNKKVIVLPILLFSLPPVPAGYMAAYQDYITTGPPDPRIFFGLVVATNLTLTGLTVGRVFYNRRRLLRIGQTRTVRRYNIAIKMLLESAVIYLIVSLTIIVERALAGFAAVGAFYAISGELMVSLHTVHIDLAEERLLLIVAGQNIIPVLLVVRISFGHTVETLPCTKPEISLSESV
ncbi:hypothetical protein B0H17DRAFT_1220425 [Mycena rosella]|uniref:Uncharacterized protein n=1 Tax=Mycena rosella TaxID=1033263 RepID=A0AAD7BAP7_MYCRO|nr:hypothetical protein B0H17DRAFT_1220425 [Mycena rosella]